MKNPLKRNKFVLFVLTAILVVVCCGLISKFAFQLAVINGDSMKPTYHNFQFVLINKTEKDFCAGNVVAIKLGNGKIIVKRIVAVPDDSIKIADNTVFVNGEPSAVYKNHSVEYAGIAENEIILNEGEYFLLGDNLSESRDSRYEDVGIINENQIIGKIFPQRKMK